MSTLLSSFSMTRAKPRQSASHSPMRFTVEQLVREFGPQCQSIDARVGDQRLVYDIAQAEWTIDGVAVQTPTSSRELSMLEETKSRLVEENAKLREKVDILLEMLAEATAEYDIRRNN